MVSRLPYIFAVVALLPSIVTSTSFENILPIILSVLLVGGNVSAIALIKQMPVRLVVAVNCLDSFLSFYVSWSLWQDGKQYIQFPYLIAGLAFLTAAILVLKSSKNKTSEESE